MKQSKVVRRDEFVLASQCGRRENSEKRSFSTSYRWQFLSERDSLGKRQEGGEETRDVRGWCLILFRPTREAGVLVLALTPSRSSSRHDMETRDKVSTAPYGLFRARWWHVRRSDLHHHSSLKKETNHHGTSILGTVRKQGARSRDLLEGRQGTHFKHSLWSGVSGRGLINITEVHRLVLKIRSNHKKNGEVE